MFFFFVFFKIYIYQDHKKGALLTSFNKLHVVCGTIPHLHPVHSHQPCSYNAYSKYQLNSSDGLGSG